MTVLNMTIYTLLYQICDITEAKIYNILYLRNIINVDLSRCWRSFEITEIYICVYIYIYAFVTNIIQQYFIILLNYLQYKLDYTHLMDMYRI